MAAGQKTGGRQKGTLNKRSQGLLSMLERDYDLHPIRKLAEACVKEVPLQLDDGTPVCDENGKPIMVPWLKPQEYLTALGKLADKTVPTLKAQEIDLKTDGLPTVLVDMRGVQEESPKKKPAPRKRAPAKKRTAKA